jgi:uncharacterized SAM-binding protein YcdF (DUF218 family)
MDYAVDAATLVEELGVPHDAIIPLPGPLNTSEEIAKLDTLVHENGWKRVGLITSAMHLRRAMKLAERRGLALEPIGSDFRASVPPAQLQFLLPTAAGVMRVKLALWERLGAAVGR